MKFHNAALMLLSSIACASASASVSVSAAAAAATRSTATGSSSIDRQLFALSSSRPAFLVGLGLRVRGGDGDGDEATADTVVADAVVDTDNDDNTASATTTATDTATTTTTNTTATNTTDPKDEDASLEDRVHAAMKKLGLSTPEAEAEASSSTASDVNVPEGEGVECKDVPVPPPVPPPPVPAVPSPDNTESFQDMKNRLTEEMDVDVNIVAAALAATMSLPIGDEPEEVRLDETAARAMIEQEKGAIQRVMENCDEVQQLVSEGHDVTLSRRALAFADMNIEVARAILIADEEDAKEEEEEYARAEAAHMEEEKRAQLRAEAEQKKKDEAKMKTVNVKSGFDPSQPAAAPKAPPKGAPGPAKKEDVIFQATSETLQKLVLESPVPVLLDVYADWCGPCKALTPALEQMAIKGGGMFRLVKLNTDEERNISAALEVQSLPTVFGIRDGKIVHHFKGMPRDEKMMQNFMMGLLGAAKFNPLVTAEEKENYEELSKKLIKIGGASGFSFAQRERLQVRTNDKLQELVDVRGDMSDAEETAKVIRSLLSNVIRDPFDLRFRKVNLENKIIDARVGQFPPALAILRSVGFVTNKDSVKKGLILGKGKTFVSVAPIMVARDTIDKWIDMNRRAIATALRKKQDEVARLKLLDEAEEVDTDEEDSDDEPEVLDPNECNLKLRIEGKKKIHDLKLAADDTLEDLINNLPVAVSKDKEITIICMARRLNVKSSNEKAMAKTLRESKLMPTASIVIKIGSGATQAGGSNSMKERAAARKSKTKTHTMQSIGIYAKDDNAKGELIDGGGGTWYEQDVTTDDEGEGAENTGEEEEKDEDIEPTEE